MGLALSKNSGERSNALFGERARNVTDYAFPLFPTVGGIAPTKAVVITAWSRLSSRGAQLSGHSARRSGG
eukprot:14959548-Heterocapsa_arctica.AAC.2